MTRDESSPMFFKIATQACEYNKKVSFGIIQK